ncbi:hypothetical protein ACJZ2D_015395 [Fusarium nematophilum]
MPSRVKGDEALHESDISLTYLMIVAVVLEPKHPNLQATPKLKRGPKPKPPSERKSKPFSPLKRKEETHSHEKKVRVLLFLINHRIYDPNANSWGSRRVQIIDGYRQPYLSEAAKWLLVKKQTIHEWWKQRDKILGITPKEIAWRPKWPELEDELFRRFVQRRSEKKIVMVSWFRTTAKHLFGELYPEHEQLFGFSNGCPEDPEEYRAIVNSFLRFLRRNTQRRTSPPPEEAPKFPPRPYEKISDILDSPQRRFHNNCILNVDETPIPFEYLDGSTYALSGDKTVSGKTDRSGWSKRKGTLILSIFADGFGRLKPKLIFEGAEPPKGKILLREGHLYHPGVTVEFNPTAYNNKKLFLKWLNEEVIPCKSSKPWTPTEKRVMTTHIVVKAWEQPQERPEMVKKAFYSCGIGLRPDGSEENLISIKDIKKEEIDFTNWEIASNPAEGEHQHQEVAGVYDGEELGLPEDDLIESLTSLSTEELARMASERGLTVDHTWNDVREELIRQLVDIYTSFSRRRSLRTRSDDAKYAFPNLVSPLSDELQEAPLQDTHLCIGDPN